MAQHLLLRLEAPLMSFGAVAVDQRRPVQAWPAVSMLTGLLANALGWNRQAAQRLDALQDRIRWAARIERAGFLLEDFQTVRLKRDDAGWTTRNVVERREGGEGAYRSPHLRYRDYRADASVLVALRLEPADAEPTLEELAQALDRPQRPLFIGRKGCPPACRILAGRAEGEDAVQALRNAPTGERGSSEDCTLFSNEKGEATAGWLAHTVADERRFGLDVHAGSSIVFERPAQRVEEAHG